MAILIISGVILTLAGIAGLLGCVVTVMRARRAGMEDASLKAVLAKVVLWNTAALGVSALGLVCVVTGIVLG